MNIENWEKLLQKAIAVLDLAGIPTKDWTFGGGTALSFWLHHRVSRDIDIFLTDAQLLLLASPRLNSRIAGMVSRYEESMASLKVYFSDGEVDFIIAPHLTEDCCRTMSVGDRSVLVETPVEIVLKKLFYRPETLKVRDIIDTAAVLESKWGKELTRLAPHFLYSRMDVLMYRLERLKEVFHVEARQLMILKSGLEERALPVFAKFLRQM